ncbi:TPA: DUF1640 domain-containing protein [Kluyvera ascorbata]|nr:DUF1640 domain-containing protein [Kluyvera ascorbata]
MSDNFLRAVKDCGKDIDKADLYPHNSNKRTTFSVQSVSEESVSFFTQTIGDREMSTPSREEIQALLAANKAEVSAISAEMRREMTEWREQMRADLRDVKDAIKTQQGSLDKHFSAQESKLNASLQIQEHKFEKSLGDAKLDIIKWALGIPAVAFTLYKLYGALTGNPQ